MKRYPSLILIGLLLLLAQPALPATSATARFQEYLAALAKAQELSDLKPYFTAGGWSGSFGEFDSYKVAEQRQALKAVATEFAGWKVKSETIQEGKTVLVIGHPDHKDHDTEVLMIRQNGVWLIGG